jgi:2',3'-cyclic-nucleotide 2'-phosphodiesterase (5'-nucleotidase family)
MTTGDSYSPGDSVNDVIAMNGDDLSLFLGAHGHGDQNVLINGVWYGEIRNAGQRLGHVELTATKTDGGWVVLEDDVSINIITVGASATADRGYMTAVAAADRFAKDYAMTVIGRLEGGPLVPVPEIANTYQGYFEDTALVHIINEAMLYYTNEYVARTPELAAAGMKVTLTGTAPLDTNANAQPGNLTRGDVSTIYKYDNNTLNIVEMTGHQFKRWMEWSYLFFGDFTGDGTANFNLGPLMEEGDLTIPYGNGNMPGYNFDQFKGVTYKVDLTKPYGERIVELKGDDGKDFDLDATYWAAVNNYRSDSQLTINAGEGSRPAVFPAGYEPARLIASEVDSVLTIDGKDPVNNGEGMLGLLIDYINRVLGGTLTNEFESNWSWILPEIDEDLRAIAIELINDGTIDIVVNNGFSRRGVSVDEVLDIIGE